MVSARVTYSIILLGAVAWCGGILLAPVLVVSGGAFTEYGQIIYRFFHPVCHQIGERSLHIVGEPLAVCARCSAIYGAFLLGTLLYPVLRRIGTPSYPPRSVLLAAAVPMMIDVVSGLMGLHTVTPVTRLLSGAVFGLAAPFFIIPAAIEALRQIYPRIVSAPLVQPQKGKPNA
jgi:uncharacterized membrane protein